MVVKNPPSKAGDARDTGSVPGSGRSLLPGGVNGYLIFLLGKFNGQRNLAGDGP